MQRTQTMPVPPPTGIESELRVGNVYACKGGGKTRYWIVVGYDGKSVNMLGVNADGKVTSTCNYGAYVFDNTSKYWHRPVIGFCHGLDKMKLQIEWKDENYDN